MLFNLLTLSFLAAAPGLVVVSSSEAADNRQLRQAVDTLSRKVKQLASNQDVLQQQLKNSLAVKAHPKRLNDLPDKFTPASESRHEQVTSSNRSDQLDILRNDVNQMRADLSILKAVISAVPEHQSLTSFLYDLHGTVMRSDARIDQLADQLAKMRPSFDIDKQFAPTEQRIHKMSPQMYRHRLRRVHRLRRNASIIEARRHQAIPHQHRHQTQHTLHRSMLHRLHALRDQVDLLNHKQTLAQQQMTTMSKTVSYLLSRQESLKLQQQDQAGSIEELERNFRRMTWKFNVTFGNEGALHDIQTSTTSLIREIDAMETKLDSELSLVKSEIARQNVDSFHLNATVEQLLDAFRRLPRFQQQMQRDLASLATTCIRNKKDISILHTDFVKQKLDCCGTKMIPQAQEPVTKE